jgi:hypothetical protein
VHKNRAQHDHVDYRGWMKLIAQTKGQTAETLRTS